VEMRGSRSVLSSIETTWAALNDPEVLKASLPGCEQIDRVGDNQYRVAMLARVGPVSAKFSGTISLSDLQPPHSYTLAFEGQGGAAGFAKGSARVSLTPDGTGTRIDYTATGQVGGKLAQIGSRLVDGAAAKVADDFFSRFSQRVAAPAAVAPAELPVPSANLLKSPGFRLALAGLIILILALYWWFHRG